MLAARTILKTIEKRKTLLLLNLGSNVSNQVGNDLFSKKPFAVRNYGNKSSNRNSTRNANSRYLADDAEEARESSRDNGLRKSGSGSRPSYNPLALVDMDKEEEDDEDEDEMKSFEQGYSKFRERTGKPPPERPSRPKEWSKPPMRKAPKGEKPSREKPKQLQSEKTSRYIDDDADESEEGGIDANEDEEETTESGVHPSNKKELQRIAETQEKQKKFNTVFDIYRYAVTEFTRNELTYGHSTLNAAEDASFLLLHELGLPFDRSVEFWGSSVLLETEKAHLLKLIRVRIDSRLPMAYIVRGCYQQGEYFYVDRRVIVPRSFLGEVIRNMEKYFPRAADSAELMSKPLFSQGKPQLVAKPTTTTTTTTEEVQEMSYEDYFPEITDEQKFMKSSGTSGEELDPTPAPLSVSPDDIPLTPSSSSVPTPLSFLSAIDSFDPTKIKRILDIGTGSGCLAILAAKYFPNVERIDAIDISEEALAVARINIKFHNLNEMIFPFQGDLFNAVPNHANYDLIIANPPYVNKRRMEHFPKEYTYEPKQAFDGGGQHGLLIVKRIILESAQYLNRGGYLLCEIGETKRALEKLFNSYEIKRYYDNDIRKLPEITYLNTKLSKNEIIMFRKEQLPNYSPPAKKVVFLDDDERFGDPIPGMTADKKTQSE
jgi:methylase of polypeptide subunit release factors